MINRLAYHLEPMIYSKRGNIVLKEDTESSTVVFVREGEFEIVRMEFKDGQMDDFMDDKNIKLKYHNRVSEFRSSSTIFKKTLELN